MKTTVFIMFLMSTTVILASKESDTLNLANYDGTIHKDYISYSENGYRIYFPFSEFREYLLREIKEESDYQNQNLIENLIAKVESRMYLFGVEECFDLKYLENFHELFAQRPSLAPQYICFRIVQSGKSSIKDTNENFLSQVIVISKISAAKEKLELFTLEQDQILTIKQRITPHKSNSASALQF